jgi:dihydrofolate reductase
MSDGLGAEREEMVEISAESRTQAHGREVGLIWAQSTSGVIGRDGTIPWRLPEDQARFKELTIGHTVVMGRLTWESLPAKVRPLPGRRNVVLTRHADYMADGATVVSTLTQALSDDEIWVIGGEQLYALALPLATRCEVTEVEIDLPREDGDAVAPMLDESWVRTTGDWLTSRSGLRYRFHSHIRA